MKYNFDETGDHRQDGSIRWEQPEGRDDIIGMGTADMDFTCAPCIRKVLQSICEENTYNYRFKPESYFQSVIRWFRENYQLDVKKDWMSNVPGTIGAVRLVMEKFSEKGDYVLMHTPYFTPLRSAIEASGRKFLGNAMKLQDGRYEIDFDDFEKKIKEYKPSIFLLVNPQNPTGRVFTQDELKIMVDICAANQVRIISDEVHFLITYEDYKHIPILAVSEKAREIAIQVFSFSKGFNIMSLPHGIVFIANEKMQKEWMDYLIPYSFAYASNSYAIAAVTAVTGGEADDWLEQVTAYLTANRDYFIEEVKRRKLPITPLKPEASFLFWIDCRESGIDPEKVDEVFMEQAGIQLNNGLEHGEEGRGFARMNFAVTRATLDAALDRIEKIFL